jgi:hypothetical protein
VTQKTVEQISETRRRLKVHAMLMIPHQSNGCKGVQPSRDLEANVEATCRSEWSAQDIAAELLPGAVAARLRSAGRAGCIFASVTASRRLQFAARCACTLLAATAAPLWLRHAGPGRAAQARPLA